MVYLNYQITKTLGEKSLNGNPLMSSDTVFSKETLFRLNYARVAACSLHQQQGKFPLFALN